MTAARRVKAAHISDVDILDTIHAFGSDKAARGCAAWAHTWEIFDDLDAFPPKVVMAKLRKLKRRGLITGCTCGCRGDFELTDKGRELIGEAPLPEPESLSGPPGPEPEYGEWTRGNAGQVGRIVTNWHRSAISGEWLPVVGWEPHPDEVPR